MVLTSGGITLGSYLKYKKYRDEISANRVNNEPVLQSIDVQLKEGKNFYKNGKAIHSSFETSGEADERFKKAQEEWERENAEWIAKQKAKKQKAKEEEKKKKQKK